MLRITLAQLNFTVGDIEGNVARMVAAAQQAAREQANIIVFSELSLCGYYPGDMLEETGFQQRIEAGISALQQASAELPQLHWVLGAPTPARGPGKRLHNSLLVLQGGAVRLQYAKQLLPTYNIFDERRHFEPGPDVAKVLRVGSTQVGLLICEDGWNDHGADYATNPFERMRDAAPDLVVSINASPSHTGKREQRHQIFADAARRHGLPILYVNQIGGHDQVVYDGASFAAEPDAGVVFEAQRFVEDVCTLQFDNGHFLSAEGARPAPVPAQGLPTMDFYRQQIVLGLRDYARRCGFTQVVVGSSGGIDSALTLALAVEALGADNVVGITMPSRYSSSGSVDDSVALCDNLGVQLFTHPIAELVAGYAQQFEASFGKPLVGLPLENLQARIRGTVLMEYSNAFGHLLLTTGNKSEISVGYCTLYGDTNGGLGLIGDLYKTEVFALSRHVNEHAGRALIPQAIIDKEPSAELAPGQRDVDSLPPYPVLDEVLKLLIEGERLSATEHQAAQNFVAQLQTDDAGRALVQRVRMMVARNEYKRRQAPPIVRVRARAFGSGRQMPIAARYV
ncbi:MAG: NAD+ synthase [Burkholderiales bacterium RIFCSPHIGHO2_12_FULL_65_48]|nr:MAG: NAD+ synthase [Burkholderiales bacterium RIFCSPHIGHO2_02_FULL_64_19]OGB15042.1 MAG: NAD+ synthase [Burkholderiales bacterium RIFCSPHIGHO2_12_FULL_65_48]OGB58706.1 MAG: NAD+ synthase [Burkholderiales bacterium RIFCSPLOWO2_12_FULL_64_33]